MKGKQIWQRKNLSGAEYPASAFKNCEEMSRLCEKRADMTLAIFSIIIQKPLTERRVFEIKMGIVHIFKISGDSLGWGFYAQKDGRSLMSIIKLFPIIPKATFLYSVMLRLHISLASWIPATTACRGR